MPLKVRYSILAVLIIYYSGEIFMSTDVDEDNSFTFGNESGIEASPAGVDCTPANVSFNWTDQLFKTNFRSVLHDSGTCRERRPS